MTINYRNLFFHVFSNFVFLTDFTASLDGSLIYPEVFPDALQIDPPWMPGPSVQIFQNIVAQTARPINKLGVIFISELVTFMRFKEISATLQEQIRPLNTGRFALQN